MDLFESAGTDEAGLPADSHAPLAVRMRPRTLDELAVDLTWLWLRLTRRAGSRPFADAIVPSARRMAVFIPAASSVARSRGSRTAAGRADTLR